MTPKRVLVMGLDCMTPELAFDRYLDVMPNLGQLMRDGTWGDLASSDPPITVPAWMVMATSQDPGSLGAYGFRHRRDHSYTEAWTANAASFDTPAVWDYLGAAGLRTGLVGFPPSYPARAIPGWRVGCFLTPGLDKVFTYPAELGAQLLRAVPDYRFDVTFRTESRTDLLRDLYAMTDAHFRGVEHLMAEMAWDLLWFVEIGMDRVHHSFWKYSDPGHFLYQPGNEFEQVIRDYYVYVDGLLGRLVERAGPDTAVFVVSDHGAKAMKGVFSLNQWLAERGYLVLGSRPKPGTSIDKCDVDWAKTTAWAWGGYYARVFLNVQGREPQGLIRPEDYETKLGEVAEAIRGIVDHTGRPMDNRVYRPRDLYRTCRGDAPDLMVYLDNLYWRAAGTLGWDSLYLFENDTGPDDAVHSERGCFVLRRPDALGGGRRQGLSLYDVGPTILDLFGLPIPKEMQGKPCR